MVENYETVEMFWRKVDKTKEFPNTVALNLPTVLSRKTQTRLAMLGYDDTVSILKIAIEAVDNGSIKKMDRLVNEEIKKLINKDV